MKKQDFLQKLSELTGIEVTKITEAINSEEEEIEGIEIPEKHIFTDDELEARLKNHASKSGNTFIEMAVKEARNSHELEFEGKTVDNLVKAALEKGKADGIAEAGKKPNDLIAEKDKIIEKLQSNLEQSEAATQQKIDDLNNTIKSMKSESMVNSIIPDNLDTPLTKSDLAVLFKNDYQIKEEETGIVFTDRNGNVLRKEKTQEPMTSEEVIEQWMTAKNIKTKNDDGRGGDDDKTKVDGKLSVKGIKSTTDFYDYCEKNNIPSREYSKVLVEIQKESPEFMLDR